MGQYRYTKSPAENNNDAIAEAYRVYSLLKDITDGGCDAEVKQIKGKLKILKVQKNLAAETEIINF